MSTALPCPNCGHDTSKITNSRANRSHGRLSVYRTRECAGCRDRFLTIEQVRSPSDRIDWVLLDAIERLPADKRDAVTGLVELLG